jgi:hypothetical protein
MNERIKELAEQAYRWAVNEAKGGSNKCTPGSDYFLTMEKEKFAELIVTDAIGVLQKRFMGDLNREDMEVRRCIEDLKKHFGVEE